MFIRRILMYRANMDHPADQNYTIRTQIDQACPALRFPQSGNAASPTAGRIAQTASPKTTNACSEGCRRCIVTGLYYILRFLEIVLTTSLITIGFDRCPFIPASMDACTSSAKALAVMAMIGICRASGRRGSARMAAVAS